ncbi:MAG: MlaD family protein [Acidobacteriota bacterium]
MTQALKVGLFVTVCLAVLAYLVIEVEDLRLFPGEQQRVSAVFDSVVGLDNKAPVRVAGVRVGRVTGITLEGARARVDMLLEQPVPLTEGSLAVIANVGILGDKYVRLLPGPPGAAPLPPEPTLPGSAPPSFDETLAKLNDIGDSVGSITGDLAQNDVASQISRLLDNLEATSADIRQLVSANRGQVDATVANFEAFSATLARELPGLTEQMRALLAQVDSVVAENRDELNTGLSNIAEITEQIQTSVDNLNDISTQVASGEGSLGKLVYDDTAHDQLVGTLDSIESGVDNLSDTLGRVQKVQFRLGLEGAYYEKPEENRTAVTLDVDPGSGGSRFYRVALVDDPRGRSRTTTDFITTTLPDGTVEETSIRRVRVDDDFTLSAQFGFRLDRVNLRAGLFESSGGAAVDYFVDPDRRWRVSLEAFDFSRENDLDPRLRLTTRWDVHENLYLLGGYDDPLESEFSSVFLGAGVSWSDDDLKYLLGSVPSF